MNNDLDYNVILDTDSYKETHYPMLQKDLQYAYGYWEARVGATYNRSLMAGFQSRIMRYLVGQQVTMEKIDEAEEIINAHFCGSAKFNRAGWEHILNAHGGHLPVEIRAVREGSFVEVSNALMTVSNTDEKVPWLPNFLEKMLSQTWHSCNVATLSAEVYLMFMHYAKMTCDDYNHVPFQLHDFGARGSSSLESEMFGGAGHLFVFKGTDTLNAIRFLRKYYGPGDIMPGFSVNATEHFVMTSLGEEGEMTVVGQLLDNYPSGILSMVIDSYDWRRFITESGRLYKDKILARNGTIVFRPDSGDPVSTTIEILEMLGDIYGYKINKKDFKVLNSKVRVLWGDGLDYHKIRNILHAMRLKGWASCNIVFGMGGGLHQNHTRDTQRYAFKNSAQYRNGKWIEIYKKPLDISKASKRGRFVVTRDANGVYNTHNKKDVIETNNELELVLKDGVLCRYQSFADVYNRTQEHLKAIFEKE